MKYLLLSLSMIFMFSCNENNTEEKVATDMSAKKIVREAKTTLEQIELIQKNALTVKKAFVQKNVDSHTNYSEKIKKIVGQENILISLVDEAKQAYRVVKVAIDEYEIADEVEDLETLTQAEARAKEAKDKLLEIKIRAEEVFATIENLAR